MAKCQGQGEVGLEDRVDRDWSLEGIKLSKAEL